MAARTARAVRRMVALDMDCTALNSRHALTERTVAAIRRAHAAGVTVAIATGRPAPALQPYIDQLALPRPLPAVVFNGACAMLMRPHGRPEGVPAADADVVFSQGLEADAARQVLRLCERLGWCASYCRPLGTFAAAAGPAHERQLARFEGLEGIRQLRVPHFGRLLEAGELPLKVVALSQDPDGDAARARAELPDGLVHVIAAEMHVEFLHPGASKGRALERLCAERLGVSSQDIVAFGDNHNDVEMLEFVAEGVAMRNAKDSVKAAADRVCEWTNDEDGVARELEAMLDAGLLRP